ncbi:hypothetical protein FQR65_LT11827 [Abscondita terminalis]|nr:hypothetical protein FQR65_LT11827 [Abscondita terminalis]
MCHNGRLEEEARYQERLANHLMDFKTAKVSNSMMNKYAGGIDPCSGETKSASNKKITQTITSFESDHQPLEVVMLKKDEKEELEEEKVWRERKVWNEESIKRYKEKMEKGLESAGRCSPYTIKLINYNLLKPWIETLSSELHSHKTKPLTLDPEYKKQVAVHKHTLEIQQALDKDLTDEVAVATDLKVNNPEGKIAGVTLILPPSHTALSGDLHVEIVSSSFTPLLLQVSRVEGTGTQALTTIQVLPEARALSLNKTLVKIPCGYFSKGGVHFVLLKKQSTSFGENTTDNDSKSVITKTLDVRWPMPQLSLTPEYVQTYPERPVMAILEFPDVVCPPVSDSPASAIPEFWLELHYCGHSLLNCDNVNDNYNQTRVQVLYSEQVRGFPGRRVLTLRCELFGLAGHYSLLLRPTTPIPTLPHTAAYVKADWSEQFVFNVHARSIFPCEVHGGGVTVLFQYPSCILTSGDRVRVFARLRANVASLTPPTSLEYVAEQRISRGQHSLHFECDLFTEKYVEYCFVYVSQAITGAVADVRMDCVPTLPVSESESGGWGQWSSWTPCSSTCAGGTRNRYRFCDSPPPRYGAKFCEGPRVQTEKCGLDTGNNWECIYGSSLPNEIVANLPEVQSEMSPFCRCGCVIHLGTTKPYRVIATSSQSCPGRTFWLIEADDGHMVQFRVEQFSLPCSTQWVKVRDGSSLSANLLADLTGGSDAFISVVNSTGSNLLLEFYSNEDETSSRLCNGAFVVKAMQIGPIRSNFTAGIPIAQEVGIIPSVVLKLTAVHIAAIFFLSGLCIATALLGAQYLCRYRKYHVAHADDQDSLADPSVSCVSLPVGTRASSSVTLLSEVISLTRLKPKSRLKHNRLRESADCDPNEEDVEVTLAKAEETLSASSTITITQQDTATTPNAQVTECEDLTTSSLPTSPMHELIRRSSIKSDKDHTMEKEEKVKMYSRRFSNGSTATLTNVRESANTSSKSDPGYYSPAASMVSRATIRQTNEKECKDKKNREKLLAGPLGSEFSIAAPDIDLEMDYYDYNVVNAGAAPGSYLGMDPAFLVWIPPLDEDGDILREIDDENLTYKENECKEYNEPKSSNESPEEELLLPKRRRSLSDSVSKGNPLTTSKSKKIHPSVHHNKSLSHELNQENFPLVKSELKDVNIPLQDLSKLKLGKSLPDVGNRGVKETKVEKYPVDSNILNEIKFADDDDEELTENQCNIERSYQDSNILSSS